MLGHLGGNPHQALRPFGLARLTADLILADLDAEIRPPMRLGVAVHRRVEKLARIGLLVADNESFRLEQRDGTVRNYLFSAL